VHFATGRYTPIRYAIKFFASQAIFRAELTMYEMSTLRSVLPPADNFFGNESHEWRDPSGR